jgi:2-dehydropantoate 2-reductase
VVVGEIDGSVRERTRAMHQLLQEFEPDAVLTDNIWGYLWGKLAYAAMLFATALNNDSMADNFADPARCAVWISLGREVMAAARARGVEPCGFDGFEPGPFMPGGSDAVARESVAAMAEFNRHSAKTHSGIWRDLAVRRRATEVDAQIRIIDTLAREAGVDTPAIRVLVELIHDVEAGRRDQSMETFEVLHAACR